MKYAPNVPWPHHYLSTRGVVFGVMWLLSDCVIDKENTNEIHPIWVRQGFTVSSRPSCR